VTWWRQLRDAAGALLSYWVLNAFALAVLCASVLWFYRTGEDLAALGLIVFSSASGVLAGQVMGFFRLRPWFVWSAVIVMITLGILVAVYMPATPATEYFILFLVMFPFAFSAGIWTLRARMHLFASWYPVMLAIGAIILIAEETGGAEAWFAGRKWAIWSVPTFFILTGTIFLLLAYLVAQQAYGLARWREEGSSPDRRETRSSGRPRVRLSLSGWAVIVLLSLALTVVTAGVAPYLWRSAPAEDGHACDDCGSGDGSTDGSGGSGSGGGAAGGSGGGSGGSGGACGGTGGTGEGSGGGSSGDGSGSAGGGSSFDGEEMGKRVRQAAGALLYLLMLLLFLLLLAAIASVLFRPTRRAVLLHHFRDPLWNVAPSEQILNLWRSIEVALGDSGFELRPWEPAPLAARRAAAVLGPQIGRDTDELAAAAEIYRRAAFGLGVGDEDVARMRAATACVRAAIRRTLDLQTRARNWFRRI